MAQQGQDLGKETRNLGYSKRNPMILVFRLQPPAPHFTILLDISENLGPKHTILITIMISQNTLLAAFSQTNRESNPRIKHHNHHLSIALKFLNTHTLLVSPDKLCMHKNISLKNKKTTIIVTKRFSVKTWHPSLLQPGGVSVDFEWTLHYCKEASFHCEDILWHWWGFMAYQSSNVFNSVRWD